MTRTLFALALLAAAGAQAANPLPPSPEPPPLALGLAKDAATANLSLPGIDADALAAKAAVRDEVRVAYGEVAGVKSPLARVDASDAARWTRLPDGRWLWRLSVEAPGALSLDFHFAKLRLPAGAQLWIGTPDGAEWIGPYTDADNNADGRFYTPIVEGDAAVIELVVPTDRREFVQLELSGVTRAFRELFAPPSLAKSGSCNVDVVCPAGNGWRDEIGAVAHFQFTDAGQGWVCTGQLMIDVAGERTRRLFSTANHCIGTDANAQSMVLYWRYESPTCRTPGSAASGNPLPRSIAVATQSGATLLATHAASDFTLVRLDDPVPEEAEAFYSGWDRVAAASPSATSIHHPAGHEKRISHENQPIAPATMAVNFGGFTLQSGFTWQVTDWDVGTTEGGSSGSGLWNAQHRLIGVLSGGSAACGNDLPDYYGRLQTAWDGGGTAATRMRDWLDPGATGAQVRDGVGSCDAPTVALESAAFGAVPQAGQTITIDADASGGAGGPFLYEWDVDGDGAIDRSGDDASLTLAYAHAAQTQVSVRVTDVAGCGAFASRALDVAGPDITAFAGTPQPMCGNGDGTIDPGERWRLPVQLGNDGGAFSGNGAALFAPGTVAVTGAPHGPDAFGYTGRTSDDGGCGYAFVDLSSGQYAVPALPTEAVDNTFEDYDDARTVNAIALPGGGITLYGQTFTQAVMSTNGYVSFDDDETGGDFGNTCDGSVDDGGTRPRLNPFHDDLVANADATAGVRYRYFDDCPRPSSSGPAAQACHVFQWDGMQLWAGGTPEGNFDFQAVVYAESDEIAYQYRDSPPGNGSGATIGIVAASPSQGLLNISCNAGGVAQAGEAVCIAPPNAASADALRVLTPAVAVGAIGAGGSADIAIEFGVDADAACGSGIAIDHIATASPSQDAGVPRARLFEATLGCEVASCELSPPDFEMRDGLYYSYSRPGNGLLNFVYEFPGDTVYGGIWYTALPDRTPTWYSVQGTAGDHLGLAAIRRFVNTAAPGGFAPVGEIIGQAWIGQIAAERAIFAWRFDDGRSGAEVVDSVGVPRSTPNRTELWYSESQSGWGNAVESSAVPGYNEFIATFLYDAEGVARWVFGSAGETGGTLSMAAVRTHCPGCPFLADWISTQQPAGTLSRTYTGLQSMILDSAITLPAPLSGQWNRSDLPMVPIAPPEQP